MPIIKLSFKPGVNKENTRYTTEGGWYTSEKVRFRQGTPEKIGGWERISANTFTGICRSIWSWATNYSTKVLGVMTEFSPYVSVNGVYHNITSSGFGSPIQSMTVTTTAGSSTATVTYSVDPFVPPGTYYSAPSGFRFIGMPAIGGNVTSAVLNKYHSSVTLNVTSTTSTIDLGITADTSGSSTGTGIYCPPNYSTLSSQSNFGQDLVYNQRGGLLFSWNGNYAFLVPDPTFYTDYAISPSALFLTTVKFPPGVFENGRIPVKFITTGVLPSPLSQGSTYYLSTITSSLDSTNVSYIYTAATGGSLVVLTDNGTGVHSINIQAEPVVDAVVTSNSPSAVNVCLVSDIYRFVFAFGVVDYGKASTWWGFADPMLIRWSDQENITDWTPTATNQAGSLRLSRGSEISTAIQARQEILVWTDIALYSLQYQGPPTVWGAQLVGDNISIINQNAVSYAAGAAFWMGVDKFYVYNGNIDTLKCDLRQYIFNDINRDQTDQIFSGTNEGFNEVWWFYCSADSSVVNRYVIYNYAEKIWYHGSLGRTAWLDSGIRDYPLGATYSYNLVDHEKGVDNNETGTPVAINAYIESAETDVGDGDRLMFVKRVIPDLTFRDSTAMSPAGTITLRPLLNSGSGYLSPASMGGTSSNADATVTRTATVPIEQYTQQVYTRLRCRQLTMKFESDALGVQWQLGSMRLDVKLDGKNTGYGV